MSDDFKNLRPPNGDDDDWLDWQSDEGDDQPAQSGDKLGFTGELSWRQDVENAFNDQLDEANDEAFDWQKGQSAGGNAKPESGGFGLTGELSWQSPPSASQPPAGGEGDLPDWLSAFSDDEPAAPQSPKPEAEKPPWLDAFEDTESDEFTPAPDAATWLASFEEAEEEAAAAPAADLPPWLREDAEQPDNVRSEPEESIPGGNLPPWLSGITGQLSEPAEEPAPASDIPGWLREDAEETFDFPAEPTATAPEPESEFPPWLAAAEAPPEEPIPGGDVPPWLAAFETEPAAAATAPAEDDYDLFAGLDEALGLAPADQPEQAIVDEPDWLTAAAPAAPEPTSGLEPYLVNEVVGDDFFEDIAPEPPAAEEDVPDWLTSAAPAAPAATGNFFDDLTFDTPEAIEDTPAPQEDVPDWLTSAAPAAPPATGNFFDDLTFDDSEPLAAAPAADVPDWFADLPQPDAPAAPPAAEPAGDFFDDFAFAEAEEDTGAEPAADMPDWLSAAAPAAPAASGEKDIFAELGLPTPDTGYDFLDQPEQQPDWFGEQQQPAAGATPGWLDSLGDLSDLPAEPEPEAEPADADFLAELGRVAPASQPMEMDLSAPSFDDLDSLLASYDSPAAAPQTDQSQIDERFDLDRLLSDDELGQIAQRRGGQGQEEITAETPDWLAESGVMVGEASAAAILRKQAEKERSLDELDERLQALHERGLELPTPPEETASSDLKTLLPGVTQFIPPAPIKTGTTGITGSLILNPAEAEKLKLLQSLVLGSETARKAAPSAIDATYAAPSFADILEEEGELEAAEEALPEPSPARRPRRRVKIDRLLIVLLIVAAVVLPFVFGPLRVGNLPPAQFAAASRQQIAYDRLSALAPGDQVLIAAEYGPTGAAELDSLTDALLRHTLLQGARPVIVSTNALGLLHVQNILHQLEADPQLLAQLNRALVANQDYTIVRYLAGSTIGLRAFGQNVPALLAADINGQATNLNITSVSDFALVVVIAERAEDLRSWAEQVAPLAQQPLVAAVGYAAAPLTEPYVLPGSPEIQGGIQGLLVGYGDAYTYRTLLAGQTGGDARAIPTLPPTAEPTEIPPAADIIPEATSAPGETVEAPASATEETTPEMTEAAAEVTPEVTPEATSPALVIFGTINSRQAVNVRQGPGRTFAPVASARPDERVQVVGRNADGSWLQIRLEAGTEGWIATNLVTIEEPPTPTPEGGARLGGDLVMVSYQRPVNSLVLSLPRQDTTPEPLATAETTAEATLDATAETTPEPLVTAVPPTSVPTAQDVALGPTGVYRDERWYSMTLGLIAIIFIITLGTLGNVIGILFRRRRR